MSNSSNKPAGPWPRQSNQADKAIRYLLDRYNNQHPRQQLDLSLNAFIFVIIRLYDSVRSDPGFKGSYIDATKVIRRHLFNHLNLGVLFKEEPKNPDGEDEEDY